MTAPWDSHAHIDVMSLLVGLAVADSERPGVSRFLDVARDMADVVAAADVPDDGSLELAPVFRPLGPDETS